MRIAFFSDTHLGHRRFAHVDERTGLNVREIDVMRTFKRVLDSISNERPDVVLHGGDFFDMVRPGNNTILTAFRDVATFQSKRDGAEFIAVAGNHEVPRAQGTGCILSLLGQIPGVTVLWNHPGEVVIERGSERVSIVCMPHDRFYTSNEIPPRDGSVDRRLLLAHAVTPGLPWVREADLDIGSFKDQFDLMLLGDYHIHRKEGKNAVYVGSTDYVSSNIWEEASQPKGWILLDTATMQWTFRKVAPYRPVVDLDGIDASALELTEVLDRMLRLAEEACEAGAWDKERLPIVRQRILNAPKGFRREVPFELLQRLRAMVFDYTLDPITPKETEEKKIAQRENRPPEESWTDLEERWTDFAERYETPADVNREQFIATGLEYLKEARDAAETNLP